MRDYVRGANFTAKLSVSKIIRFYTLFSTILPWKFTSQLHNQPERVLVVNFDRLRYAGMRAITYGLVF